MDYPASPPNASCSHQSNGEAFIDKHFAFIQHSALYVFAEGCMTPTITEQQALNNDPQHLCSRHKWFLTFTLFYFVSLSDHAADLGIGLYWTSTKLHFSIVDKQHSDFLKMMSEVFWCSKRLAFDCCHTFYICSLWGETSGCGFVKLLQLLSTLHLLF